MIWPWLRMVRISKPMGSRRRRRRVRWTRSAFGRGGESPQAVAVSSPLLTIRQNRWTNSKAKRYSIGESGVQALPNPSRHIPSNTGTVIWPARRRRVATRAYRSRSSADSRIQSSSPSVTTGGSAPSSTCSRRRCSSGHRTTATEASGRSLAWTFADPCGAIHAASVVGGLRAANQPSSSGCGDGTTRMRVFR
jgi:hypothetical protein